MYPDLQPHKVYRLAATMDKPSLRRAVVIFLEYVERPWDIRRAHVAILNNDGSSGDRWLVTPSLVLPF